MFAGKNKKLIKIYYKAFVKMAFIKLFCFICLINLIKILLAVQDTPTIMQYSHYCCYYYNY